MSVLPFIGLVLYTTGFVLGFFRTVYVAVLAINKVTDDWKPLTRKSLSDLEPTWLKKLWRITLVLLILGFALFAFTK